MSVKRTCPDCGKASSVVEVRPRRGGIYRRIKCECGNAFSTYEIDRKRFDDLMLLEEKTDRLISDVRKASRILGEI